MIAFLTVLGTLSTTPPTAATGDFDASALLPAVYAAMGTWVVGSLLGQVALSGVRGVFALFTRKTYEIISGD